jgi:hypothetical protein
MAPSKKQGTSILKLILGELKHSEVSDLTLGAYSLIHVTVLGVIMGVTLTLWVQNFVHDFLGPNQQDFQARYLFDNLRYIVYPVFSFAGIVIITFEYAINICVFRRVLNLPDVISLYLVGVFLMVTTCFFKMPWIWWLAEGLFLLSGAAASANHLRYCGSIVSSSPEARQLVRKELVRSICSALPAGIGALLVSYLLRLRPDVSRMSHVEIGACVVLGLMAIFVAQRDFRAPGTLLQAFEFVPPKTGGLPHVSAAAQEPWHVASHGPDGLRKEDGAAGLARAWIGQEQAKGKPPES